MLIPIRQCEVPAVHGAKAVQLARLARAGLPVPAGVVIPATLPDDQVAAVTRRILAWAASQRARHGLIIRSSAPAEDGTRASFAGLYSSHFTCARPRDIQAAVRAVRTSGSAAVVREYAHASHVEAPPAVAVIVQAAMRPCSAGILAGQIRDGTWHDWQIEAVHGSAVPLTSGQASGEIHQLGREPVPASLPVMVIPGTLRELGLPPGEWAMVDDRDGGRHRVKIQTSAGGLVTVWLPPSWRSRAVLSSGDAARLLDLAAAAADAIDADGIDIEWAITPGDGPFLLQARPLTRPLPGAQDAGRRGTDAAGWQGIPASPGIGIGPSLQLGHPARSAAGMVVICGNLGPGAATTLLQRPAAIAATTGGPLSHAAIVARELGIPCATGLPEQLRDLPDGTILAVDGLAGTVSAGRSTGHR